jgi:DNA-binding NarL/FixJ family response regulator
MAQGFDNSAIAGRLSLGEKTLENYVNTIYQHLGISRADNTHPRVKAVLLYLDQSRQAKL